LRALLSPDEIERAMRFHFPLHRQRFIITRGLLRKTLSQYLDTAPDQIRFIYGPHGKPYLENNSLDLQFNVSHSADLAVFALTAHLEIGVDIEKMEPDFNEGVAKRFFSPTEYAQLMALSSDEKMKGFYQIWSKKEAIIKALGQGVFLSLTDFSVSLQAKESITLTHLTPPSICYVEHFAVPEHYQAAFATLESIGGVSYYKAYL